MTEAIQRLAALLMLFVGANALLYGSRYCFSQLFLCDTNVFARSAVYLLGLFAGMFLVYFVAELIAMRISALNSDKVNPTAFERWLRKYID